MSSGGVLRLLHNVWYSDPYNVNSTTGKYWNSAKLQPYQNAFIQSINCAFNIGCISNTAYDFFKNLLIHLNHYDSKLNSNTYTIDKNSIYKNSDKLYIAVTAFINAMYKYFSGDIIQYIINCINCMFKNNCIGPQVMDLFHKIKSIFQIYIEPYISTKTVMENA